jgi:Glycosyl transferases group 1
MLQEISEASNENSRVLLLSMRNLKYHVSRGAVYELEDVIQNCDTVDVIAPKFNPTFFKVTNKIANYTANILKNGKYVKSLVNQKIEVHKKYDLFFFFCQSIQDILVLNSIKGWRKNCRYAVCWLDELWAKDIDSWLTQLRMLEDFDNIFLNFDGSINRVTDIVRRPCHSLPYAVDAIKFCPYPNPIARCVDVLNIGRRSVVTHNALLDSVKHNNLFYIYDTIQDLYMADYRNHRGLYTNFIKRSHYMIVNKAKFDLTGQSNPQEEVGPRFYEAAAAGTIMLGVPPKCTAFTQNFDWSNAVIEIPFDCSNITDIIALVNQQSNVSERIRKDNITNCLLRHDWVYRWEKILKTVGLETTPQIQARKASLQNLAQIVNTSASSNHESQLVLS